MTVILKNKISFINFFRRVNFLSIVFIVLSLTLNRTFNLYLNLNLNLTLTLTLIFKPNLNFYAHLNKNSNRKPELYPIRGLGHELWQN